MSLDAIADDFVTRKMSNKLPTLTLDTAQSPLTITSLKNATATDGGKKVTADNPASKSLSELTKYIPTELLSAYIALIALPPAVKAVADSTGTPPAPPPAPYPYDGYLWAMFWICALLCPVVVYVLATAKGGNAGADPKAVALPIFPMVASLIAFILWAAVLPNSVISHKWPEIGSWVGFAGVILGTLILSLGNMYLNGKAGVQSSSS